MAIAMPSPISNSQSDSNFSYIRFLHASPGTSAIDIYVNQEKIGENISYQNFTTYLKAVPGIYNIVFYPTGTNSVPLLFSRIKVSDSMIYTAAFIGLPPSDYELELITDRSRSPRPNTTYMRFIHLAPNAPNADIYVDNHLLVSDIMFQEVTNYIALRPGKHSILFRDASSNEILLQDPTAILKNGNFYACYFVGLQNSPYGLHVLIPLEGTSYLQL